jgi:hypothetical protein
MGAFELYLSCGLTKKKIRAGVAAGGWTLLVIV